MKIYLLENLWQALPIIFWNLWDSKIILYFGLLIIGVIFLKYLFSSPQEFSRKINWFIGSLAYKFWLVVIFVVAYKLFGKDIFNSSILAIFSALAYWLVKKTWKFFWAWKY